MPLELHPVTEADFPDLTQIQLGAFETGMASKLNPKPHTPERIEKFIQKNIKAFHNEPDLRFIKVVDTELGGKMIAAAKWRINEKERTEEEIQTMLPVPGEDEEGNPAAQDFMRYLHGVRKKFMGTKPFYCEST